MIDEIKHIVRTQEYQVDIKDKSEAHQFQFAISRLQESRINVLLNDVLSRFDDKGFVYQFQTIELDLGTIRKTNYENELAYRIEEELIKFLNYNILENGSLLNGSKISIYNKKLENLKYFLLNGYFKWNAAHSKTSTILLAELCISYKEELVVMLKKVGKDEQVRKRMIFQFDNETLDDIITLVTDNKQGYIISYKNNLFNYQEKERMIETGFRSFKTAIWEIVLGYVFAEGKSYYDKKNFLQYLIKKIGAKYNIDYLALLGIISYVVNSDQNMTQYQGEFKQLIIEITAQEQRNPIPKGKKDANVILNQLTQVLDLELFKPQFPFTSKKELNYHLMKMLRSKNQQLILEFDKWLNDKTKRRIILAFINHKTLNEIIELSQIFSIKVAREFIDTLVINKPYLSIKPKELVIKIHDTRGGLILDLPFYHNELEEEILQNVLISILKASKNKEDHFIKLLDEVKPRVSKKYEQSINRFNQHFYPNLGKVVLENIISSIQNYTDRNPFEYWSTWIEDRLQFWVYSTRLSRSELLRYIDKKLEMNKASSELNNFIKKKRNLGFPELLMGNDQDTIGLKNNVLVKADFASNYKKTVMFILEQGKLPWWIERFYTLDNFNENYLKMWSSGKDKVMIIEHFRLNKKVSYARFLDNKNLILLISELDNSKGNDIQILFKEILQFIKETLLPLGMISQLQFYEFRKAFLRIILDASYKDIHQKSMQCIKKCIDLSEISFHTGLSRVFESFLKDIISKISSTPLKKRLKEWLVEYSKENLNLNSRSEVFHYLYKLLESSPGRIDVLLQNKEFRTSLTKELSVKDVNRLIRQNIDGKQLQFYNQSMSYLEYYKPYTSIKEYKDINEVLGQLLLLKLNAKGLGNWGMKDWNRLLFHCLTLVIGKPKNKSLHFRLMEELDIKNEKEQSGMLSYIDKMDEYANDSSSIVLMDNNKSESDMSYKKLGEDLPRAFKDPVFINNAGLIILAPFLGSLFEKLGLMDSSVFKSKVSISKAVQLLTYLATGKTSREEYELTLNKILCGLNIYAPLDKVIELKEAEKEIADDLLLAVIKHWSVLKETSIHGLRESFLQRDGKLVEEDGQFLLRVEQKSFDMLLDQIPWNISMIKLSWMQKMIEVEWR